MSSKTPTQDVRVTLKTIAELADVHVSTVSRALNPEEADKVHPRTLRRVRALAEELGYEPDPWGRSLRTRRSMSIGLLLPRLVDGVLALMFEAAEDRARTHGYQAVTSSTRDRPNEQARLVAALRERRVDGLVLATTVIDDPLLDKLADDDVPFVLMNRSSDLHLSVAGDDVAGGRLATEHLLEQGHTRIAMMSGPRNVSTAANRTAGYREALTACGVPIDDDLVVWSSFLVEDAYRDIAPLLDLPDRPSAVVAVNDVTAIGVLAAARDRGLRVPEDLAVVGYNDSPIARMLPVPLSSVHIPLERMGALAVDLLISRLRGEAPTSITLVPELVVRTSSQSPRGAPRRHRPPQRVGPSPCR